MGSSWSTHILESQLCEIEVQKEAEIAAALETWKKEGYTLGCQERVEAARQVVDIAGTESTTIPLTALAIHILCEITVL